MQGIQYLTYFQHWGLKNHGRSAHKFFSVGYNPSPTFYLKP